MNSNVMVTVSDVTGRNVLRIVIMLVRGKCGCDDVMTSWVVVVVGRYSGHDVINGSTAVVDVLLLSPSVEGKATLIDEGSALELALVFDAELSLEGELADLVVVMVVVVVVVGAAVMIVVAVVGTARMVVMMVVAVVGTARVVVTTVVVVMAMVVAFVEATVVVIVVGAVTVVVA